MMVSMVTMPAVVRGPRVVVSAVIWIAPIIAVIAAWVISVVTRITVVAVCGESDSDGSDPD